MRNWLLGAFTLSLIALDQLTKSWADHTLSSSGSFLWEGLGGLRLSLDLVENRGTAWGLFASYTSWLIALRLLLVFCLFYAVGWGSYGGTRPFALACILAGAIGNLLDIAFYGHVIDFIHVVFWSWDYPVFNIADSCICGGIAWWLGCEWRVQQGDLACR